jgi:hypothetical protein
MEVVDGEWAFGGNEDVGDFVEGEGAFEDNEDLAESVDVEGTLACTGKEAVAVAEEDGDVLFGDGLESSTEFGDTGVLFAGISRSFCRILDVSGVIGTLAGVFGLVGFDPVFADIDEPDAEDFEVIFRTGKEGPVALDVMGAVGVSFIAIGVVFSGFGAALVELALLVDFFFSGIPLSMVSETTFLGLPLFLTTSADILYNGRTSTREG